MNDFYSGVPMVTPPSGLPYLQLAKLPVFVTGTDDWIITTKIGDRCDKLAYQYWGDTQYWRYVALVNNLPADSLIIPPGTQIRIPRSIGDLQQQLEAANVLRSI